MPLHQKLKPPDERNSVLPSPLMMMMMIEKLYKFIDFVTKTTVYVQQKREKNQSTRQFIGQFASFALIWHIFYFQSNNFRCGIYANIDHTINIIYIISNSDELIQNDFSSSFFEHFNSVHVLPCVLCNQITFVQKKKCYQQSNSMLSYFNQFYIQVH